VQSFLQARTPGGNALLMENRAPGVSVSALYGKVVQSRSGGVLGPAENMALDKFSKKRCVRAKVKNKKRKKKKKY